MVRRRTLPRGRKAARNARAAQWPDRTQPGARHYPL